MLSFALKVLLPLLVLLSPWVNVSGESSAMSLGVSLFLFIWLLWGLVSFLRAKNSPKKKNQNPILSEVPLQYSIQSDFDLLGVDKTASKADIETAYQAKMASFDPDRIAKMGKSIQQEIKTKQERITKAYNTLMEQ